MRWKKSKRPKEPNVGDKRERSAFLFLPKKIGEETRWLEHASWIEEAREAWDEEAKMSTMHMIWVAREWKPDLPLSGHGTPPECPPPPRKTPKPQEPAAARKSGRARIRKGARVGQDRHFFDFEDEDIEFSVVVENPESTFGCTCRAPGYGAMKKHGFDQDEKYGSGALHVAEKDLIWIETDKSQRGDLRR